MPWPSAEDLRDAELTSAAHWHVQEHTILLSVAEPQSGTVSHCCGGEPLVLLNGVPSGVHPAPFDEWVAPLGGCVDDVNQSAATVDHGLCDGHEWVFHGMLPFGTSGERTPS